MAGLEWTVAMPARLADDQIIDEKASVPSQQCLDATLVPLTT